MMLGCCAVAALPGRTAMPHGHDGACSEQAQTLRQNRVTGVKYRDLQQQFQGPTVGILVSANDAK